MTDPKVIAFLLPQFHEIAENNEWWGHGFTEWTNVRKALPRFRGHRQPRVPLSDNYYNLLDPSVRDWQAELARGHGVHGFCYYHYWFGGRQLLEKPVDDMIERGSPDFPFCMAWANEPWNRSWDGNEREVLMAQTYGDESEWRAHFAYLEKAFRDHRYIKVDGRPVLLIYRSQNVPACEDRLRLWRQWAVDSGFPGLHVVSMITFHGRDPRAHLFDAYVEFEPNYTQRNLPFAGKLLARAANVASRSIWNRFGKGLWAPRSLDYKMIWKIIAGRPLPAKHYPGAFVDWDNSARKHITGSLVMRNFSVQTFRRSFSKLFRKARDAGAPFIFLNAWNEWAEGTYLEPDEEHGMAYLEAVKAAVEQ